MSSDNDSDMLQHYPPALTTFTGVAKLGFDSQRRALPLLILVALSPDINARAFFQISKNL